mgnify:FL=1
MSEDEDRYLAFAKDAVGSGRERYRPWADRAQEFAEMGSPVSLAVARAKTAGLPEVAGLIVHLVMEKKQLQAALREIAEALGAKVEATAAPDWQYTVNTGRAEDTLPPTEAGDKGSSS